MVGLMFQKGEIKMSECYKCGFWNSDYEVCTCYSGNKWYACPIESRKPENKKAMEDFIKWCEENSPEVAK